MPACHSRVADCVAIDNTTQISLIVIPGLTRNPVLIQWLTILDAGSVIPDLIRDRHDGQKFSILLNYDTDWHAGIRARFEYDYRRGSDNHLVTMLNLIEGLHVTVNSYIPKRIIKIRYNMQIKLLQAFRGNYLSLNTICLS